MVDSAATVEVNMRWTRGGISPRRKTRLIHRSSYTAVDGKSAELLQSSGKMAVRPPSSTYFSWAARDHSAEVSCTLGCAVAVAPVSVLRKHEYPSHRSEKGYIQNIP
ncbi:hypothetical protein K470DRAFT_263422 [Piedraia hortae CBS 480.64]|uniref:C2H2-type domain-containing protein n=1 Tax=Piedraia hortae CBS 480.64 TaxID=1314780 RepID=A0A6A7C323_9PEZI|nr:hypothetical protein K470DRAFT_263422 [Piedraia hortae CBS 480.64]